MTTLDRTDRIVLYRLLGGLLEQCPTPALLQAVAADPLLGELSARAGGGLGAGLAALPSHAGEVDEVRADYVSLFIGPKHKRAPPWESVYRTPERKVMGSPNAEVTRSYAARGVGFDGIGSRPADHVALELEFVALLLEREDPSEDEAARAFLDAHLLAWVPDLARDIALQATTPFWRVTAEVLGALCESERRVTA